MTQTAPGAFSPPNLNEVTVQFSHVFFYLSTNVLVNYIANKLFQENMDFMKDPPPFRAHASPLKFVRVRRGYQGH
jgi:hypothetical protein